VIEMNEHKGITGEKFNIRFSKRSKPKHKNVKPNRPYSNTLNYMDWFLNNSVLNMDLKLDDIHNNFNIEPFGDNPIVENDPNYTGLHVDDVLNCDCFMCDKSGVEHVVSISKIPI
jgi:hypothetical protein